ncbi:MAG: MFS transporter, partial [Gemmataceae bacterium]
AQLVSALPSSGYNPFMGEPPLLNQRPTYARLGVLAFICSLSMLTYLDRICIMQVQDNIQTDLRISKVQMGFVFSAFLIGYALFEVPGGWMGDRWGSRRVLIRIVLWWSFFTALTGSADQIAHWLFGSSVRRFNAYFGWGWDSAVLTVWLALGALITVRFLFGCGEAGAYPNMTRIVGAWFPFRERGLAQGGIWFSARIGGAIAPFVIVQLAALAGWRAAFWVLGFVGIFWCVFFWMLFRNTPEEDPRCNEAERDLIRSGPYSLQAHEAGLAHGATPWRKFLSSGTVRAMCVAAIGVNFGWYFYPTWQPLYFEEVYETSFDKSAIIVGLPFLCGAFGCLLGGRVSDQLIQWTGSRRWGRSLNGIVGFVGAGLCVLATGFVTAQWQAVVLLCLAFFINDIAIPPIWAVASDIGGKYAGTLSGFMNMMGGIGAIASPIVVSILLDKFLNFLEPMLKWRIAFTMLACSWFIAALAWLWIDATKRLDQDEEPAAPISS